MVCDQKKKEHVHPHLSDIRSDVYHEMMGISLVTEDDENVKKVRLLIEKEGESVSLLMKLASALCLQFRYRDALSVLDRAIELDPKNYQARRMRAIRLLTTGRLEDSLTLFLKLDSLGEDPLDTGYRIALCYFYQENYGKAKGAFEKLFPLCDDNPDMYIATLYWYLLAEMMLGENIEKENYRYRALDFHHHQGYDEAVRVFFGESEDSFEEESQKDNLTRIMYLTGLYYYAKYRHENEKAEALYQKCLACQEYWSSFSGLAIWYRELRSRI